MESNASQHEKDVYGGETELKLVNRLDESRSPYVSTLCLSALRLGHD